MSGATTVVVGTGPDQINLVVSEDAYHGDAEFTISVNGIQIGGTQTATTSHAAGMYQDFVVEGSFSSGDEVVGVNFINDDYSGSEATGDRNLYVENVTGNGPTAYYDTVLASNGTVNFAVPMLACYCRGTLVLTDQGEIPVEALAIGDCVVTISGILKPIRWIGHRSYVGRFLAGNPAVQPVLLRAGSVGNGLPRRDLRVSPSHAMYLDGVLVPAKCLLNGISIIQERELNRVDYFHIELDHHDVILAEGAPSESFVDDDSRGIFSNAAEWETLHPGRARMPAIYYASRIESGYDLDAIRRRLAKVAAAA